MKHLILTVAVFAFLALFQANAKSVHQDKPKLHKSPNKGSSEENGSQELESGSEQNEHSDEIVVTPVSLDLSSTPYGYFGSPIDNLPYLQLDPLSGENDYNPLKALWDYYNLPHPLSHLERQDNSLSTGPPPPQLDECNPPAAQQQPNSKVLKINILFS